jgi:hypothetical protein
MTDGARYGAALEAAKRARELARGLEGLAPINFAEGREEAALRSEIAVRIGAADRVTQAWRRAYLAVRIKPATDGGADG